MKKINKTNVKKQHILSKKPIAKLHPHQMTGASQRVRHAPSPESARTFFGVGAVSFCL